MEKRRAERVELTHDIVLNDDLTVRNLSEDGIQIQAARPLKLGRELKVQLDLGTERISIVGTVRWCSTELALKLGADGCICGLEFRYESSVDRDAVRRYLTDNALSDSA